MTNNGVKHKQNRMNIKIADKTPAITPDPAVAGPIAAKQSRRHFVRNAGLIVPVILTVGSRSALAATCLSPSASASINLTNSRPDRPGGGICTGRGPSYWKSNPNYNPATPNDGVTGLMNTLFGSVFAGGLAGTMRDVCALTGTGNFAALGGKLAAAWLNLKTGLVSANILSEQDLQAMWAGRFGTYEPIAGASTITWGEAQIIAYLQTTMT